MKNGENCSSCFREEDISKLHNFIHAYSLRARQITPRGHNFDCKKSVTAFIIHCKFQF